MTVAPRSRALITQRKPTGCVLGHRRAHDQDRVGVREILLRRRRAAAPERGAQTGHRGAMSYPGLVADGDHAQAAGEELLDQVVLFVVERRAAEVRDRCGTASAAGPSSSSRAPRSRARACPRRGRRPCPCAVSRSSSCPLGRVRRAVPHASWLAPRASAARSSPRPSGRGGPRRSATRDRLRSTPAAVAVEDELAAADGAVRTHRSRDGGVSCAAQRARAALIASRPVPSPPRNLLAERPRRDEVGMDMRQLSGSV